MVRKQEREREAFNRWMTSMEVIDVERAMIEIRERFPSIVFAKSVSPMNKIEGLTTNVLEIQNEIDEILNVTFNNNLGRRGQRFFLRGEVGGFVRSEEGFIKDRMKVRPRRRKFQLVGRRTNVFENTEGTITFSFQFLRRAMCYDICAFQPNQVVYQEGPRGSLFAIMVFLHSFIGSNEGICSILVSSKHACGKVKA